MVGVSERAGWMFCPVFRKKVAGAPRLEVGGRLGPKKGENWRAVHSLDAALGHGWIGCWDGQFSRVPAVRPSCHVNRIDAIEIKSS